MQGADAGAPGDVDDETAQAFAREWIEAWNDHDLERILAHYADDVVLLSPVAQARLGDGRVVGIEALRRYWAAGLATQPDLRFTLREVLAGHRALTIRYVNHRGRDAAETFEFGPDGRVVRSLVCYGPPVRRASSG